MYHCTGQSHESNDITFIFTEFYCNTSMCNCSSLGHLFLSCFTAEGVYVDTDGQLVRHATMQWGETPYAIGNDIAHAHSLML